MVWHKRWILMLHPGHNHVCAGEVGTRGQRRVFTKREPLAHVQGCLPGLHHWGVKELVDEPCEMAE